MKERNVFSNLLQIDCNVVKSYGTLILQREDSSWRTDENFCGSVLNVIVQIEFTDDYFCSILSRTSLEVWPCLFCQHLVSYENEVINISIAIAESNYHFVANK